MPNDTPDKEDLRFAVLATDVITFAVYEDKLQTLLIDVHTPPHFTDIAGFPGGLIDPTETALDSAERHLKEKGGMSPDQTYLEQLYTFSKVNRDPRGRVVSVAYLGLAAPDTLTVADDGRSFWKPVEDIGELAYDHNAMLDKAVNRLQSKLEYTNLVQELMPQQFTLTELQNTYEIVLGRELDKRNFRRKIKDVTSVEKTGDKKQDGAHRPAALYRFTESEIRVIEIF
jgi:8-oxo-dGTP diphosphatase